jgi:hypothetical protein
VKENPHGLFGRKKSRGDLSGLPTAFFPRFSALDSIKPGQTGPPIKIKVAKIKVPGGPEACQAC